MNVDMWGAVIQSFATLLAVAVGYFFSRLSDNKQWKREKIEQIRNIQLNALLEVAYSIERILQIFEAAAKEHNQCVYDMAALSVGMREARIPMDTERIREMLMPICNLSDEANKMKLQLKLLRYDEEKIGMIEECLEEVTNIERTYFSKLFERKISDDFTILLHNKLNSLVQEAESGLRQ